MSLDYNGAEGQGVPPPTVAGLPSWLVRYGQALLPSDRHGATQGSLLGAEHQALFAVWARFRCKRCLLWSPLQITKAKMSRPWLLQRRHLQRARAGDLLVYDAVT